MIEDVKDEMTEEELAEFLEKILNASEEELEEIEKSLGDTPEEVKMLIEQEMQDVANYDRR